MTLHFRRGSLVEKTVWAEGLFTLHVQVDGIVPFEPGQFLQVGLELEGEQVYRPYSVASPFGEMIEFYIVLVEDGKLTPHLWRLEKGDTLDISERAAGRFTLKQTPDAEHLWLVGTGTGLAPYIAMLRTDVPWTRYRKIILVHGARYAADLSYAEELQQWEKERPGQFCYVPTITREQSDGVLKGRINELLESEALEHAANTSIKPENSAIMLCGNPAMLDAMESLLEERGLARHRSKSPGQIVLERYW